MAYAGSDAPFDDAGVTKAAKRCGSSDLVQIPVYLSPIAVIYNLSGVDKLQLSPETLAQIMNQQITTWNDPAIAAENPDVDLPDTRITPVNRSDDSGTTFNYTDYLSQAAPKDWPYPAGETWPVKGGEAAEGTSGVVDAVKNGDGTIGYADFSQAGDLGVASVKVGSEYVAADGRRRRRGHRRVEGRQLRRPVRVQVLAQPDQHRPERVPDHARLVRDRLHGLRQRR